MRRLIAAISTLVALAGSPALASNCAGTSIGATPLDDLGAGTYKGAQGGLYPAGANQPPEMYATLGRTLAQLIVPRNAGGLPDQNGSIVFLTIGMSNTNLESTQLLPLANADPLRDGHVVVVNGAQGGMDAEKIKDPLSPYWTFVGDRLAAAGVTAPQVQAVWLKEAIAGPQQFGAFPGHANRLRDDLRAIVGILKARFPNLLLVYPSSRIYAGYATTTLNPEPYAYESGFAVKWLIEQSINVSGAASVVPWIGWGPYLWADGLTPRSDGLTWSCTDFNIDGTHPSQPGALKVAQMILNFLHTDQTSTIWYES